MKTPWDFYKSVFKTYKQDTPKLLDDCFEIDWLNSKCEKIIKGEEQLLKIYQYLRANYQPIREAYKSYSGIAPSGRVFSCGPQTMTELLHNCDGFIDGKAVRFSDIDLEVIACKKRTSHWLTPEK